MIRKVLQRYKFNINWTNKMQEISYYTGIYWFSSGRGRYPKMMRFHAKKSIKKAWKKHEKTPLFHYNMLIVNGLQFLRIIHIRWQAKKGVKKPPPKPCFRGVSSLGKDRFWYRSKGEAARPTPDFESGESPRLILVITGNNGSCPSTPHGRRAKGRIVL